MQNIHELMKAADVQSYACKTSRARPTEGRVHIKLESNVKRFIVGLLVSTSNIESLLEG